MNELIQRLNENMQLFGLSQRTQETYSYRVVKFMEYFNKPLDSISGEDIRQYFLFLKNNKNYSRAAMTVALCAIKFFYEKTLYKEFNVFNIIRPKRVFKLPVILSREEVRKILMNIRVLRHRACLTLIYSCGLRLNEGVGLKVNQVDIVFKAKFRDGLRKLNPLLFNQIAPQTWTKNWVVNSIPVGNGCHAMKYLAQYVFRVAISNNRIIKHQGGFVTFKYKDSKTKVYKFMKLTTEEFIRRFLQHVLPKGFVKVRYFGLFAIKNRNLLCIVRQLFDSTTIINIKPKDKTAATKKSSTILCPVCGNQMNLVLTLQRLNYYDKSPPLNNFSFFINDEHLAIN